MDCADCGWGEGVREEYLIPLEPKDFDPAAAVAVQSKWKSLLDAGVLKRKDTRKLLANR